MNDYPTPREIMVEDAHEIERLKAENRTLRNELCLRCGQYKMAHKGSCDGCRWHQKGD